MSAIGKIIKEARLGKGYTQEELASKVGVQKSAIAKWENGRVSEIKRSNLKALAIALELDPNVLLSPSEDVSSPSNGQPIMGVGNIIFSLRKERSLTQEAFANALNKKYGLKLNKAMISKWENNIDTPSLNYVKYMAIFFNVSLDYMLGTFPSSSTSALPEQDRMLLENFHRLSDSQQARLLAYLDGLLDAGEAIKGEMNSLAEDAEREVDRIVAQELAAAKKSIAK